MHRPTLGEDGSSTVEFVLVGGLLTLLTFAVVQFGLGVYVRNVVHDAAVEGAFHAALADTTLEDGAARTADIVTRTVGAAYADDVAASSAGEGTAQTITVTVRTTLPLLGMFGAPGVLEVSAHAPAESLD